MLTKHITLQYNDMMRFIENPNLPQGRVILAAISEEAGESIKKLDSLSVKTVIINKNSKLPEPINSHADIQILHMGSNNFFCFEHLFSGEFGKIFSFEEIYESAGNKYPDDVRLNCTIIGNKLICNTKTVSRTILEYADRHNMIIINVNQGYARCSICVVNENTIITDDKSIYTAAGKIFNDVQFISKGSIGLRGYDYGFIGGCCGKIAKNKIAFNGAIESHSDYKTIIDCLERNNIECIELHNDRLIDIGGIMPLCEEIC